MYLARSGLQVSSAVGMATGADDLGLVGDPFAMSAAIFRAVGSAATGSVGAFLGVSHSPPFAGPALCFGRDARLNLRCGIS